MSYQTVVKNTFTRWNYDKTMLLIENFERLPQLWNTSLKDYRDRNKKAEAMTQLALIVRMDEAEVSRKLHNLRCQLNSEMRKMKQKKCDHGAEDVYESKWEYFAPLRFLIAESKLNETASSVTENSSKSSYSFCKTTPNYTETTVDNLEAYNSSCFKRKKPTKHLSPRKKSKRAHKSKSEKNTILQRALCLMERCTDDCQIFADFIASRLRKLHEGKREELQRSIQLQILQAEAEESIAVSNHNENRASSAPMFCNLSDASHN